MAWGNSTNVVTTNLASGTDSPALARQDLNDALLELKNVIDGRNTANGVAGLNASQKIAASQIPNELNSTTSTDLTLDPATDKVRIEHIINLNPQTVAQLQARTDVIEGDVAVCSNGDTGSYCLAVATGEDDSAGNPIWKRIALGSEISAT